MLSLQPFHAESLIAKTAAFTAHYQAYLAGDRQETDVVTPLSTRFTMLTSPEGARGGGSNGFAIGGGDVSPHRFASPGKVSAMVAAAIKRRNSQGGASQMALGQGASGIAPGPRKKRTVYKADTALDPFSIRRLKSGAAQGDPEACRTLREEAEKGNNQALEELCAAAEECTTSLNPLKELALLVEKKPEVQERIKKLRLDSKWLENLPPKITQEVPQNNFETLLLLLAIGKTGNIRARAIISLLPRDLLQPYLLARFQAWQSGTEPVPENFATALEEMAHYQVSHRDYLDELAESDIPPFVEAKERVDRYFEQFEQSSGGLVAIEEGDEAVMRTFEETPLMKELKARAKREDKDAVNALIDLCIREGQGWPALIELDRFFSDRTFIIEAVIQRVLEDPKMLGFVLVLATYRKSEDKYSPSVSALVHTLDLTDLWSRAPTDMKALEWVLSFADLGHPIALQKGAALSFQLKAKFDAADETRKRSLARLLVDGLSEMMAAGNSNARQIVLALDSIGNFHAGEALDQRKE